MALFSSGKSICPLCGRIIEHLDDAVATPAFLRGTHRLAIFSDAVFHKECFDRCQERKEVDQLLSRFKEKMKEAPSTLAEYEKWAAIVLDEFG